VETTDGFTVTIKNREKHFHWRQEGKALSVPAHLHLDEDDISMAFLLHEIVEVPEKKPYDFSA
jgi:hypothetical protein